MKKENCVKKRSAAAEASSKRMRSFGMKNK
jgi:hypothetical protein